MEPLRLLGLSLPMQWNQSKPAPIVSPRWVLFLVLLGWAPTDPAFAEKLTPETLGAWRRYIELTEKRRESELESGRGFLVGSFFLSPSNDGLDETIRRGQIFIKKMTTLDEEGKDIGIPGGMVHHWYGAIFAPGATLDAVLRWVQDYPGSRRYYEEVEDSRLLSRDGDLFRIFLRLKRTKIITVYYDTEHEVLYTMHGPDRASSRSYATKIAEIEGAGTPKEREKTPGDDRGFLWRLNSYWRFERRDDGVAVDCESVSLSREIPRALEWMIRSYVESVPRESLERTLQPIRDHLAR